MRSVYAAVALGLGTLALGACSQEATETEEAAAPLTATEGKLYLPAVEGNPAAVYFELENTGDLALDFQTPVLITENKAVVSPALVGKGRKGGRLGAAKSTGEPEREDTPS